LQSVVFSQLTDVLYTIFLVYNAFLDNTILQCSAPPGHGDAPKTKTPCTQYECLSPPHIIHIHTSPSHILPSAPLSSYKYTSPSLPSFFHPNPRLSQIKPKPLHTTPVLPHEIHARGLRVFRCGKEHALVASGFLLFADAAGLGFCCGGAFGWA
jgi:hypothetical protein